MNPWIAIFLVLAAFIGEMVFAVRLERRADADFKARLMGDTELRDRYSHKTERARDIASRHVVKPSRLVR